MVNKMKEWGGVVALVAIIALGISLAVGDASRTGGITNYDAIELSDGLYVSASTTQLFKLKVGASGTALTKVNSGTCYFAPTAATIAGSVSQIVTCQATAGQGATTANGSLSALSGVTANDHCSLTLSTTTALNLATTSAVIVNATPLYLDGASASTTAGHIHASVHNASTSPYLWATGATASGTAEYICTR